MVGWPQHDCYTNPTNAGTTLTRVATVCWCVHQMGLLIKWMCTELIVDTNMNFETVQLIFRLSKDKYLALSLNLNLRQIR